MESVLEQLRTALKDRYRVDAEIGRGGMATVFRAQDLRYDRPVAIKVLSPDISSVVSAERFTREIRISARLSHPNILTVFDSGEIGELLYYVMTYVEGESLRARMKRETYLPMEDAIRITCEVADALSYAHEQGVIHRDIKPENILLRAGHVLVADFGIARLSETEGESLTAVGMSVGTAAYMSPEQSAGDPVTPRSDIYSLGTTLYEMLAGQLPFTGPNPMAIAARRMMEPVPPIRIVRPAVPEQLEAVVMCSMERVAADRFQTMDDFKRAILGEAGTMSMTASRYTPLYMTSTRMTPAADKKRRMAIWGGIGALVIALAVAGVLFSRKGTPPPAAATSDARRVAVLYFDDGSNGTLRYLADGLTESLIDRLSTISALDVISKDGVRMFRGQDVRADSVARALQVGSIVRGRIQPEGGKVQLEIRLVDAAAAVDIARKSFEVDTARIVTSQAELATNVVDFLREHLGAEIRLRDERAATTSSQAWTLVERAGKLRKDADSLGAEASTDAALTAIARADSLLAAAQRLDGQWAKIPVLRANAMYAKAEQLNRQPSQMATAIDEGLAHAEQALRLQPNSPDALEIKGQLLYHRYARRVDTDPTRIERLLPQAESTLTKAVNLNRDQAGAWATLSHLYYAKPDIQAANSAALNAYRADAYLSSAKPIMKRLFWTSHDLEQFPEALHWCTEGRRRFPTDPHFTSCRLWMYTTRFEKPDLDSAWAYRERFIAVTPEKRRPYAAKFGDILVAGAIARAGLPDSARHVLLRARATPEEDPGRELSGNEAVVRVILGDHDEAVQLIANYLTANPGHRKGFATRTGPWWRDIQGNPKFKALIAGAR
ncbi:MAG: serine/threonine-protein kinase [Gemmatimonadota bacterium]|nr:serine/threonine-protein kinase [Gemmatimonadota bacterium]